MHYGCLKSFDTVGVRNNHMKQTHGWEPRACTKKGCDSTTLFPNKAQYQKHVEEHGAFTPTTCRYPNCASTTVFQRSKLYNHHLQTVHKLVGKDKDMYKQQRPQYIAQKCQVPDCPSKVVWKDRARMRQHLRDTHGLSVENRKPHLP